MITINIIAVGKVKEKYFIDAIKEYSQRLSAFCKLNITEVPDIPIPQNASGAQLAEVLTKEANSIFAKIPKDNYIFALCVERKQLSSEELAEQIGKLQVEGKSSLTFIIGSSCGLSDEVKCRANAQLSFSKMTFPHQLFRVMLVEQIYRAFKILNNHTYHK